MEFIREHKRDLLAISLLMIAICISIGYAALSSNLNINGASQINNATWDIHWENVQIKEGSVTALVAPTIDSGKTTVSYEVQFDTPGQFYEFTVDAKNGGSIDGMINTINSTLNGNPISTLPSYFIYTVSYSDGSAIQTKQQLDAGEKETYKVRIEYKKDISVSDLPNSDQTLALSFTATYVQKDSTAVPVSHPESFATDSWETIVGAVRSGNIDNYHVGDTKEIDLGSLGVHTLRIANMSTPDACSGENFSQAACGFVLEFEDILLSTHHNYSTAVDGFHWSESLIRTYLNSDFYNLLPSSLRDGIISTVLYTSESRSGSPDNYVATSTDYIYLFNTIEVFGRSIEFMPATQSRQLDYYASIPVNVSSTDGAIKNYNGFMYYWWLRNAYRYTHPSGMNVDRTGSAEKQNIGVSAGVSPAFRIG